MECLTLWRRRYFGITIKTTEIYQHMIVTLQNPFKIRPSKIACFWLKIYCCEEITSKSGVRCTFQCRIRFFGQTRFWQSCKKFPLTEIAVHCGDSGVGKTARLVVLQLFVCGPWAGSFHCESRFLLLDSKNVA